MTCHPARICRPSDEVVVSPLRTTLAPGTALTIAAIVSQAASAPSARLPRSWAEVPRGTARAQSASVKLTNAPWPVDMSPPSQNRRQLQALVRQPLIGFQSRATQTEL